MLLTYATTVDSTLTALLYGDTFDRRCFQIAPEQDTIKPNTTRAIEHLAMASWRTYEATSAWYRRNNSQIIRILFESAGASAFWKNSTLQLQIKFTNHKNLLCCLEQNLLG